MFDAVLHWLDTPILHVASATMSPAELIGFVTGAWCVWLVARQNLLNWPVGIANNVMFLVLFYHAGLFADAGLQVFYMLLAFYGWWAWMYGSQQHDTLAVSHTSGPTAIGLAAATVAGTAGLTVFLAHFTTSAVPFFDALTTALSLAATWGQCRKQVECWWIWIAADLIYVPLYAYKGLWLTAVLYVGFIALCVNGYLSWKREAAPAPLERAA